MCIDPNKITLYVGEISDDERNELLANFQQSLMTRHQDLQTALEAQNWKECAQLSHNLKSNALYFGAEKLHKVCQTGEKLFLSSTIENKEIASWFTDFNQQSAKVLSSIDGVLKEKPHDKETRER